MTYGVLQPDVHKAVERQSFDIGDGRVRQDGRLSGLNLGKRRVLLGRGLRESQRQTTQKGHEGLLGEHRERDAGAKANRLGMRETNQSVGMSSWFYMWFWRRCRVPW